jgi:hypothetical protein
MRAVRSSDQASEVIADKAAALAVLKRLRDTRDQA